MPDASKHGFLPSTHHLGLLSTVLRDTELHKKPSLQIQMAGDIQLSSPLPLITSTLYVLQPSDFLACLLNLFVCLSLCEHVFIRCRDSAKPG